MESPRSQYQSYLLRLWRSNTADPLRIHLEQIGSERRYGFVDLESLFDFLREQAQCPKNASREEIKGQH